jgi:hypothetical protein
MDVDGVCGCCVIIITAERSIDYEPQEIPARYLVIFDRFFIYSQRVT